MKSSYKPRFLQAFLKERSVDSVPELIEIDYSLPEQGNSSHRRSEIADKQEGVLSQNVKINLSQHRTSSARQQQPDNRLTLRVNELGALLLDEKKRSAGYQSKLAECESTITRMRKKNQQLEVRTQELSQTIQGLVANREQLQSEVRGLQAQEVRRSNPQPASPPMVKQKAEKDIFGKLQDYLKGLIEEFITILKPQRISKTVQTKIEDFLTQLLMIDNALVDTFDVKSSYKSSHKKYPSHDQTSSCQQAPFPALKINESCPNKAEKRTTRFNYIKETVDPSITEQSAYMSVSYAGRQLTDRETMEQVGRSKSQRRRKIFS